MQGKGQSIKFSYLSALSSGTSGGNSGGTSSGTSGGTSSGTSGGTSSESVSQEAKILTRAGIVGPFEKGYQSTAGATAGADLVLSNAVSAKPVQDRLSIWDADQLVSIGLGELLERLVVTWDEKGKSKPLKVSVLNSDCTKAHLLELKPPTPATLVSQLKWVIDYADLRSERNAEIAAQIGWPLGAWTALLGMRPRQHTYTVLLLRIAQELVVHLNRRFKHLCGVPRPSQLSSQVHPMIDVPQHGAWPGGHASEAFIAAGLLNRLITAAQPTLDASTLKQQLDRLAARIATNRVVAGLHYPVDTMVGRVVGERLATYLVDRCGRKNSITHASKFDANKHALENFKLSVEYSTAGVTSKPDKVKLPSMAFFWEKAMEEWK